MLVFKNNKWGELIMGLKQQVTGQNEKAKDGVNYQDQWGQWVFKVNGHEYVALEVLVTDELVQEAVEKGIFHDDVNCGRFEVVEAFQMFHKNRGTFGEFDSAIESYWDSTGGSLCLLDDAAHFVYELLEFKVNHRVEQLKKNHQYGAKFGLMDVNKNWYRNMALAGH